MRNDGDARRALLERGDQMPVLDVVAERVEPDFGRLEAHLRRAPQPAGVVDDPHRVSGAACAAHSCQTPSVSSAATEPASSAVVRLSGGGALADQHGRDAGAGQRNRGGQPGRAAADHDNRRLLALIVRHQNARLRCVLTD